MAADKRVLQREKSKSSKNLFNGRSWVLLSQEKSQGNGQVTWVDENT